MSQNDIEQIELSIEAAKEIVARGHMAERLADNPDFKKIILEGYFRDEASRLVLLLADAQTTEEIRVKILRAMDGIGALKQHLSGLVQMGRYAANEIEQAREALEELRAEELDA